VIMTAPNAPRPMSSSTQAGGPPPGLFTWAGPPIPVGDGLVDGVGLGLLVAVGEGAASGDGDGALLPEGP
jgi:hypothetical protein